MWSCPHRGDIDQGVAWDSTEQGGALLSGRKLGTHLLLEVADVRGPAGRRGSVSRDETRGVGNCGATSADQYGRGLTGQDPIWNQQTPVGLDFSTSVPRVFSSEKDYGPDGT